jgi:F-type H+-transporting ATPase subunit b
MMHLAQAQQNPLVPDITELIIGAVAFLIVFGLLGRVLLPRMTKVLAERTDAIEGGLHRAEEAQVEAKRTLEQYRAQLAEARHDASRLREEAKEQGAQIKAELRAEGEAERQRIVEAAHAQLDADRQQAITALRAEIGTLAEDGPPGGKLFRFLRYDVKLETDWLERELGMTCPEYRRLNMR